MKKRILIVDDEQGIRDLLKFKLINRGYEVATAESADEFWMRAMESKFDLIILDIWLKGRLGTNVYGKLLEAGLDRNIPVIFVTALIEDSPRSHVKVGCKYANYGKPLDMKKFMGDVDLLLNADRAVGGKVDVKELATDGNGKENK